MKPYKPCRCGCGRLTQWTYVRGHNPGKVPRAVETNYVAGHEFGKLVFTGKCTFTLDARGRTNRLLECECVCGNIVTVLERSLETCNTSSCGCLRSSVTANRNRERATNVGLCKTVGCIGRQHCKGLCVNCYHRYRYRLALGDSTPLNENKKRSDSGKKCILCGRKHAAYGLCRSCYYKERNASLNKIARNKRRGTITVRKDGRIHSHPVGATVVYKRKPFRKDTDGNWIDCRKEAVESEMQRPLSDSEIVIRVSDAADIDPRSANGLIPVTKTRKQYYSCLTCGGLMGPLSKSQAEFKRYCADCNRNRDVHWNSKHSKERKSRQFASCTRKWIPRIDKNSLMKIYASLGTIQKCADKIGISYGAMHLHFERYGMLPGKSRTLGKRIVNMKGKS